jgi:hypothetical protein
MGCGFFERVDEITRSILEMYSDIYFLFDVCNNGYLKRIVNVVRLTVIKVVSLSRVS